MRLRSFLLILSLVQVLHAGAQKQANVWYFGDHAGLDFNTSPPTALLDGQTYFPPPNQWNEGISSICDSAGTLLFYSNGEVIWNALQQVMPNGSGLMGHASSTHAALIVPQPLSDRYFYTFTTDASENSFTNGLRYSMVDICLDGGEGDVMPGRKNILLHGIMSEKIAAVSHSNGEDYWIIGHEFNTDVFHVYLLTPTGITDSLLFPIGPVDPIGWGGQITVSPDGTHLAYGVPTASGYLALFDFDPGSGTISNARVRPPDLGMGNGLESVWGVAFSADGSKLYLSTTNLGSLRQLDLNAGSWSDILASAVLLGTIVPGSWASLCLGPDNMIYLAKAQHAFLGRIEFPNVAGTGCSFSDDAVALASNCSLGLPTLIAGHAYRNAVANCHGQEAAIPEALPCKPETRIVPKDGHLSLSLCRQITRGHVEIYSADGSRVRVATLRDGDHIDMDLQGLTSGIYLYRVSDANGPVTRGSLVMQ